MRYCIIVRGGQVEEYPNIRRKHVLGTMTVASRAEEFEEWRRRQIVEEALEQFPRQNADGLDLTRSESVVVTRFGKGTDNTKLYDGVVEVPPKLRGR